MTGFGGATDTALSQLVAEYAKQHKALIIAFAVIQPVCEGGRQKIAENGISELNRQADSVVIIPLENKLPEWTLEPCNETAAPTFKRIGLALGSMDTRRLPYNNDEIIRAVRGHFGQHILSNSLFENALRITSNDSGIL
ncbi:hypothetical protein LJC15_01350 [Desulfovibrio sp. OttesenSCG-928-G11]|nr:hypothetical protein [Desulfovibrio sp. OttesenSCG-928-G11]